jgi:hypothetical protein
MVKTIQNVSKISWKLIKNDLKQFQKIKSWLEIVNIIENG